MLPSVNRGAWMRSVVDDVVSVWLAGCVVRLFTNDIVPTADSLPSDFVYLTEGAGTAGRVVVTWGPAWTDGAGRTHATGARVQWTLAADPAAGIACHGYVVVTADLASYRFGARFDAPQFLTAAGDAAFAAPDFATGGDVIENVFGGDAGGF